MADYQLDTASIRRSACDDAVRFAERGLAVDPSFDRFLADMGLAELMRAQYPRRAPATTQPRPWRRRAAISIAREAPPGQRRDLVLRARAARIEAQSLLGRQAGRATLPLRRPVPPRRGATAAAEGRDVAVERAELRAGRRRSRDGRPRPTWQSPRRARRGGGRPLPRRYPARVSRRRRTRPRQSPGASRLPTRRSPSIALARVRGCTRGACGATLNQSASASEPKPSSVGIGQSGDRPAARRCTCDRTDRS